MAARRNTGWSLSTLTLLSPWILTWLLFALFPIGHSIYLSFTRHSLLNPQTEWIGLGNYSTLLHSAFFWNALLHTVVYTLGVVPLTMVLAIAAAVLVNTMGRMSGPAQAALFLPGAVSVIVIATIFKQIYAPDGLLDHALTWIGIDPPRPSWLLNPRLALGSVMGMSIWASFGFYMLLYVAAMRAIPTQLYEAAEIDGAGPWQRFWRITLPMLRPISLLVLVLNTINCLQVFPEIFVMTEGGPLGATTTTVYYLYTIAFKDFHMGKACALSYLLTLIILATALTQMAMMRFNREVGD